MTSTPKRLLSPSKRMNARKKEEDFQFHK